jgi:hypothetical protein
MRPTRGACAAALLLLVAGAASAASPAIDAVTPERSGELLAASVRTSSLPGDRLSASLRSGLPAAIELRLEALDRKNHRVAESHLFYRIVWDLWDEVLRCEGPGEARAFADASALESYLGDLERLPVAAFATLDARASHRLRVGCRLHPVAPRETERLTRWVAGDEGSTSTAAPDGREVSVGLSDVIRFFYKGSQRDADELDPRFSAWFVPAELKDVDAPASAADGPDGGARPAPREVGR